MGRRLLLSLGIAVAGIALALVAATAWLSRPKLHGSLAADRLDHQPIAPLDRALTFARLRASGAEGPRVLLVRALDSETVTGIDVSQSLPDGADDPIDAYHALGYDALARLARDGESETHPVAALDLPARFAWPHIGVGTNYRAHAKEAMLDGEPFLFPKLAEPTPWNAPVPAAARLDYEAELCALTLSEVTEPARAELGFLLCNDFTDRWALVGSLDLEAPMGTTGFAAAKGKPGFLPVGPLLVIPRRADWVVDEVHLELYVNGRLRQGAPTALMVWKPTEILRHALTRCDQINEVPGGTRPLTECSGVPARTLLPTGTPSGVLFHPVNVWYPGAYLRPGDEVVTVGSYLGWMRNAIVDEVAE